jgi:hypothetical protein
MTSTKMTDRGKTNQHQLCELHYFENETTLRLL